VAVIGPGSASATAARSRSGYARRSAGARVRGPGAPQRLRRGPRDHRQLGQSRERLAQFLGDAVGEIGLARIAQTAMLVAGGRRMPWGGEASICNDWQGIWYVGLGGSAFSEFENQGLQDGHRRSGSRQQVTQEGAGAQRMGYAVEEAEFAATLTRLRIAILMRFSSPESAAPAAPPCKPMSPPLQLIRPSRWLRPDRPCERWAGSQDCAQGHHPNDRTTGWPVARRMAPLLPPQFLRVHKSWSGPHRRY
jgi:hypothetical protein